MILALGGIVLGVYQSSAKAAGGMDVVSQGVDLALRLPVLAMNSVADWTSDFSKGITEANSLARRNRDLEAALQQYQSDRGGVASLRKDIEELRAMARLPAYPTFKKVPADLVGYFPQSHRVMLNVGAGRMVKPGAPVIGAGGLVGQVVEVSPNSCYVNLVTHPDFSVGARVVRAQSQEAGIASGQASETMLLSVFTEGVVVKAGDLVTTSGLSTVYPEGIVIGHAGEVWQNKTLGLQEASVLPLVSAAKIRHAVVLVR